ncbi:MAG: TetR family transcriptional regulator [Crocinitomicaceae bacterium]|nr:TetR family transcriptional regulator [Crocinitomicaceae bacterium]|tara:strand:+ start:7159 stop:7743 length:585 start_codon:yes stop_codon:yes gene_type:complete
MNLSKRQIEIVEAATKLIGEKGIQNLTTKNLALEMGFSEPALYRHFSGKTDILKAVLVYYKEKLKSGLQSVLESQLNGLEKLEQMMKFQFNHFSNNPAVIMVIFAETSFQYDNVLSKMVVEILEQKQLLVSQIIRMGQDGGSIRKDIDATQLATLIMGSMRFTVLRWRLSDFSFDLRKKGVSLWQSTEKLIKKG